MIKSVEGIFGPLHDPQQRRCNKPLSSIRSLVYVITVMHELHEPARLIIIMNEGKHRGPEISSKLFKIAAYAMKIVYPLLFIYKYKQRHGIMIKYVCYFYHYLYRI